MAPRLAPGSIAAQLTQLVADELDACIELLSDDTPQGVSGRVHECRKKIKWLRSTLRACRRTLSKGEYQRENHALRDAARHLAGARRRAAERACCEALSSFYGAPPSEAERILDLLAPVSEHPSEIREERLRAKSIIAEVRGRADQWLPGHEGNGRFVRAIADEYRRARRGFRASLESPDPKTIHDWRKHVKYHMHHIHLLRDAADERDRGEALTELAESLGSAHDLADLRATLRGSGQLDDLGRARPDGIHWYHLVDAREAALSLHALQLGSRLFDAPRGQFRRALSRSVATWKS